MKLLRSAGIAFAVCSLFSAAASSQTDPLKPVPISQAAVADVDPALWVVEDSDTTIYLFGTVHILKPGLGWFDEGVKEAFDASDTLVLEMVSPPPAEANRIMSELSFDKSGKPLRDKMSAEERAAYEAALKDLGLPAATFDHLDPWAAAINVYFAALLKGGYDLTSGVEIQLTAAAKAGNKPIIGLETMQGQLAIFDTLPEDIQLGYVSDTASSLSDIAPQTDRLVALWSEGDTDGVAQIMNAGFDTLNLTEPLLTRRNANWARWIDERMKKPGKVFIAVGAGHLSGPVSVQQLLAAYGLQAKRVSY